MNRRGFWQIRPLWSPRCGVARPDARPQRADRSAAPGGEPFRATVFAMTVACIVLLEPAQAMGQAHNATAHGQLADEVARLSERIGGLEAGMGAQWRQSPTLAIIIAIAAGVAASTHSAYLVEWLSRHRLRPVLAWVTFGEGRKLVKRSLPGGPTVVMVRITNVGQVAAMDVVSRARVGVSSHMERRFLRHARPDLVGSLHPGTSTDILVEISEEEHSVIQGGGTARLEITLEYMTVDNRRHSYIVGGSYSEGANALKTVSRG